MAMTAWQILGSVGLDASAFEAGLREATETTKKAAGTMTRDTDTAVRAIENRLQTVGNSMIRVGAGLTAGIKVPMMAVTATITAATRQLGLYADSVLDASFTTGLGTDTLQAFENVARAAGVSTDALGRAAEATTRRLRSTTLESAAFANTMEYLGVRTRDAAGEMRSMDEMMPELLTALSNMENETERNSLAVQVFGRQANELIPVLALGSDEIDRLTQEAHDMGQVLSLDSLNAANELRIGMEQMQAKIRIAWREVSVSLVPVMTRMVNLFIQKVVPAIQRVARGIESLVEWFEDLDEWQQTVLGGLAGALAASGPLLMGLGAVLSLVPQLTTAFTLLKGVMLAFTGPVGIFALIAGGIATYLLTSTARAQNALDTAKESSAAFRDALADADDEDSLMSAVTAVSEQLDSEGQRAFIEYSEQAIATADDIQVAKERIVRYYAEIAHADQIARVRLRIAQIDAEIAAKAIEADALEARRDDTAAELAEKRQQRDQAEAELADLREKLREVGAAGMTRAELGRMSGLQNLVDMLNEHIDRVAANTQNVALGMSEMTSDTIGGLIEMRRQAEQELDAILTGAAREVEAELDVQTRVTPAPAGVLNDTSDRDPLGVKDPEAVEVEFEFAEGTIGRAIEELEAAVEAARTALLSAAADATEETLGELRAEVERLEAQLESLRARVTGGYSVPVPAPMVPAPASADLGGAVGGGYDAAVNAMREGVVGGLHDFGVGGFTGPLAEDIVDALLDRDAPTRATGSGTPRFPTAGVSQDDRRALDAQRQYDRDMARRYPVPAPGAPMLPGAAPASLPGLAFQPLPSVPSPVEDIEAWTAATQDAADGMSLMRVNAEGSAIAAADLAEALTRSAEAGHAVGDVTRGELVDALEEERAKLELVREEVEYGGDEWAQYTQRLARVRRRLMELTPETEDAAQAALEAANANVEYHEALERLGAEHADYEGALREQVIALEAAQAAVEENTAEWREYELAILRAKAALEDLEPSPSGGGAPSIPPWMRPGAEPREDPEYGRASDALEAGGFARDWVVSAVRSFENVLAQLPVFGEALNAMSFTVDDVTGQLAMSFDPMQMFTDIITSLLTASEPFTEFLEKTVARLTPFAERLGTLMSDALDPLVDVALKLLEALWPLFELFVVLLDVALKPLVWVIENVVTPVFTFVARLIAGIWNALASVLNLIPGVNLPRIDLEAGRGFGSWEPPPEEGDPDGDDDRSTVRERERSEVSFGGTPQAVQLAVATPLVEASSVMLDAATMMQNAFASLMPTGGDLGLGALPPFTSAIERMTPVLERLLSEGVSITTGSGATGKGTAATAYLRGI